MELYRIKKLAGIPGLLNERLPDPSPSTSSTSQLGHPGTMQQTTKNLSNSDISDLYLTGKIDMHTMLTMKNELENNPSSFKDRNSKSGTETETLNHPHRGPHDLNGLQKAFDVARGAHNMHDGNDTVHETAPPGMEHKTVDTTWSTYNKNHKTEESTMNMQEQPNTDLSDEIQAAISRLETLTNSYVEPDKAVDIVTDELSRAGYDENTINEIIDAVSAHIEGDNTDGDESDICTQCNGSGEGMYDGTTCSACNGSGETGTVGDPEDFDIPFDDESMFEEIEEEFDLNNGYNEFETADMGDYFPTGSDGPSVPDLGPGNARQGDNPEQKKLEIAEAHKDLVYNYRKFLKESNK